MISPDTTDITLVFPITTVAVALNSDLLSDTSISLNSLGLLPSNRIPCPNACLMNTVDYQRISSD